MKALVIHGKRDLRIGDAPSEDVGAGQVRLRIRRGGICGSDLHYYFHGGMGAIRVREPIILGHEVSGEVVEAGAGVEGLAPGDLVIAEDPLQQRWYVGQTDFWFRYHGMARNP